MLGSELSEAEIGLTLYEEGLQVGQGRIGFMGVVDLPDLSDDLFRVLQDRIDDGDLDGSVCYGGRMYHWESYQSPVPRPRSRYEILSRPLPG